MVTLSTAQISLVLKRGAGWQTVFFTNSKAFERYLSPAQFQAAYAEAHTDIAGGATVLTGMLIGMDLPEIVAGNTAAFTIPVSGASPVNTPTVILGWSAALEVGLVVTQAWVLEPDSVAVSILNNTVGNINPVPFTVRATVFQY